MRERTGCGGVGGELAREEGASEGWSEGNGEDKGRVNSLWKRGVGREGARKPVSLFLLHLCCAMIMSCNDPRPRPTCG